MDLFEMLAEKNEQEKMFLSISIRRLPPRKSSQNNYFFNHAFGCIIENMMAKLTNTWMHYLVSCGNNEV